VSVEPTVREAESVKRADSRRADGGSEKHGDATVSRQAANRSGERKAAVTESARRQEIKKPSLPATRGSSLLIFSLCSCDRPGCYDLVERTRRSPLQRFCSLACRHALERVLQREELLT